MYVLFDIGATNCRIGISKDGVRVDANKTEPTPKLYSEGMVLIKTMIKELVGAEEIRGAAGGIAGTFNQKKSELVASRLTDWVHKPIRDELFDAIGAPLRLENDTATVGLGEAHFGAAKGAEVAVYITVSTGIGGVKIVDGSVDESAFGFEPGHQIISLEQMHTEGRGEFESFASGSALSKKYGKIPSDIHDPAVWSEVAKVLAVGIYNTILHWSPHVVVLGGGVVVHADLDVGEVSNQVKLLNHVLPEVPEIRRSTLEDLGGLHGALVLLRPTIPHLQHG